MSNWFAGRMKPARIVEKAINGLALLADQAQGKRTEALGIIEKNFTRMTEILYKKKEGDEASSRALQLVTEISHTEFLLNGLNAMYELPVEQRKQFTIIFTGCLAHQTGSEYPIMKWIQRTPRVLDLLLSFYEHPELAVSAGEMLRLCAHHAPLARQLLQAERLDRLFSFFSVSHFDVSADSFATFRELIVVAPNAEEYLSQHTADVIQRLHSTLDVNNYAACRQSLKLIGEIVTNFPGFRDAYLHDEENLKTMMKLMSSVYKNISMEAFHVFKLFVACEDKPEPVLRILKGNAAKLIEFIHSLLDGIEDQDLQSEKDYLLMQLGILLAQAEA